MATLLFVHGTGVRGKAYDACFASMQQQVAHFLPGVKLEPCLWGDSVGAELLDKGASVPTYDPGRVDPASGEREVRARENVRWSLLYQDPLYEMRSLAALLPTGDGGDGEAPAVSPLATQPVEQLRKQFRSVVFSAQVTDRLHRAGHDPALLGPAAIGRLEGDEVFPDALASPGLADPMTRRLTVARAFVAAWMNAALDAELPGLAGDLRDLMYAEVVLALGGAPKGIADRLAGVFAGLVSRVGTSIARRRRTVLTDASFPAAADILLYQARGRLLRNFIGARIRHLEPPAYVLAHSLGGIASFELLAGATAVPVAGLITAGTQAPFLYEMDALATLRHGTKLPDIFPDWLNFYDLDDMLSYVGAGVFPHRVRDVELTSREPFPQSHSAYWTNDSLWREIAHFMA